MKALSVLIMLLFVSTVYSQQVLMKSQHYKEGDLIFLEAVKDTGPPVVES